MKNEEEEEKTAGYMHLNATEWISNSRLYFGCEIEKFQNLNSEEWKSGITFQISQHIPILRNPWGT